MVKCRERVLHVGLLGTYASLRMRYGIINYIYLSIISHAQCYTFLFIVCCSTRSPLADITALPNQTTHTHFLFPYMLFYNQWYLVNKVMNCYYDVVTLGLTRQVWVRLIRVLESLQVVMQPTIQCKSNQICWTGLGALSVN